MAGVSPGATVWVERDGSLEPRRVLAEERGALSVQDCDGAEERLAARRVVFISAATRAQVGCHADLCRHRDAVAALLGAAEPAESWELLLDEGLGEVPPGDLSALLFGDESSVSLDALQVLLDDSPPWFKRLKTGVVRIQTQAVVEERQRQESRTAARRREFEVISAAFRAAIEPDADPLAPAAEAELDMVRRVAARGDVPARAERILTGIYPDSTRSMPELAFRLMVDLGRWDEHQDLNLLALGLPRDWPAEALAEADALLAKPPAPRRGTWPLSPDLYTVAIDDASTREVDDALGIEELEDGVLLHVLIADAAAWIQADTALDREARERAATAYHPVTELEHPMLPTSLAYGPMSLAAGEPRMALDLQLHCGHDGELISMDVVPVELVLSRRVTYEEADEILAAARGEDPLSRTLHRVHKLSEQLQAVRLAAGAVLFLRQEFKVRVSEDRVVTVQKLPLISPAQTLVSECMIAAGAAAGHHLEDHGADGVFRVQPPPDEEIHFDPARAGDPVWLQENIRKLRRVEFSLSPGPHAALGLSAYCQVTSPIRRYADLVMQRQLAALADTGIPVLDAADLGEVIAYLETTVLGLNRAQNAAVRYWTMVALGDHVGEPVEAVVVEEQGRGLLIELTDWGLRTRLHPSVPHRPGDRISVRLVQADARVDILVLRDGPEEVES